MSAYSRYVGRRFLLLLITVFIAMTVVFFVPRLVPGEPMTAIFADLASVGGSVNAQAMIAEYRARFGLDEPLWIQYISFWRELLRGNLGISISNFPAPVSELLVRALPWTIGLLTVTTILSWLLGSVVGAAIGWRGRKAGAFRLIVPVALLLYTTPYYILALILIFLFAFIWPIFPLSGAYSVGSRPGFTLDFILDVLHHAMLPALSILLVSLGWWFLSMRSLIISSKGKTTSSMLMPWACVKSASFGAMPFATPCCRKLPASPLPWAISSAAPLSPRSSLPIRAWATKCTTASKAWTTH